MTRKKRAGLVSVAVLAIALTVPGVAVLGGGSAVAAEALSVNLAGIISGCCCRSLTAW